MPMKKIVSAFSVLLLAGNFTIGQTSLTLDSALKYALENNETLQQARLDIENSRYKVNETRALALPQVNINSSVTAYPILQKLVLPAQILGGASGEFISIEMGQTWNAMSQVQFSQQLFNKQVFEGVKASKSSSEYYKLLEQYSRENVIQQVAVIYYQVIISRNKIKVNKANMQRILQLEALMQNQYKEGLAKKVDVDRVKVSKSNIESSGLQLEYMAVQQENLLKYYLGMPVSDSIIILDDTLAKKSEISAPLSLDSLDTNQLTSIQLLRKKEDLLKIQQKAYKAEYFPSLALNAVYQYNTQNSDFNLYSKDALNYDVSYIGLTLRIPVFDGNARRARIKQADISLMKIHEEQKGKTNALIMSNKNAQIQLRNSLKVIETQQHNKVLAEEVFNTTQANYKNGLATLTELLNAETELVSAQNSYNEALLNFKVAEIEALKSQGKIETLITRKNNF